jgi:elongation factor G
MTGQRETIAKAAEGRFVYKRLVGSGAGEFAVVKLRIEPLPRGAGIIFNNETHDAVLPAPLVASTESGVRNAARFGLNGFPIVDVCVVLVDAAYHDTDSPPEAFAKAGAEAFRAALKEADVVPIY